LHKNGHIAVLTVEEYVMRFICVYSYWLTLCICWRTSFLCMYQQIYFLYFIDIVLVFNVLVGVGAVEFP